VTFPGYRKPPEHGGFFLPILRNDINFPNLGNLKANMVTETEVQTQEPAQIYDIDSEKFIDNPALKTPAGEQETETETEVETETEDGKKSKTKEKEQESETEVEVEKEKEEEEEQPDPEKDEEDVIEPDAYVEAVYGEKYGFKTQKDLDDFLEGSFTLEEEHEALKTELQTVKADAGKTKFNSEQEEHAFNFIKRFDVNRQGESLDTYAKLISMDVDKSDDMMVLEEKFIHEHPEWNRAQAQRMFQKHFEKNFTLKKEKFDGTEEEYNQEVSDLNLMKISEVAKAKSYLKDQQSKYKPKTVEAKPTVPEVVTKSIEKHTSEFTSVADKTNELVFDHNGQKYTFKFEGDKKKKINEAVAAWVKNPASYAADGKLLGINKPEEMIKAVVGGMYMNDVIKAIADQVKHQVAIKRVDEISETKPEKRKGGTGEIPASDDLDAQAMKIIKRRQA
jgi:hypothetical protein